MLVCLGVLNNVLSSLQLLRARDVTYAKNIGFPSSISSWNAKEKKCLVSVFLSLLLPLREKR